MLQGMAVKSVVRLWTANKWGVLGHWLGSKRAAVKLLFVLSVPQGTDLEVAIIEHLLYSTYLGGLLTTVSSGRSRE